MSAPERDRLAEIKARVMRRTVAADDALWLVAEVERLRVERQPGTEWLALWGTDDPDRNLSGMLLGPFGRIECADEGEARAIAAEHWRPRLLPLRDSWVLAGGVMNTATRGPQRRLLCTHQPTGVVAWPTQRPTEGPAAAAYSCGQLACIRDAAQWVRERTGHFGTYTSFAAGERAA